MLQFYVRIFLTFLLLFHLFLFIFEGKYSREIQKGVQEDGVESKRWHIPAADRRAWLCLVTEDPNSLSSSTPSSSSSPSSSSTSSYTSSSSSSTSSSSSSTVSPEAVQDPVMLVPPIENIIDPNHKTGFVPQTPRRLY